MSNNAKTLRNLESIFRKTVFNLLSDCSDFTGLSSEESKNLKCHCGDQSVGRVGSACQKGLNDFPKEAIKWISGVPYEPGRAKRRLILVLESPHVKEFEIENGQMMPKGPAKGKTGSAIRSHLTKMLDSIDDYELILMNAIQFRCSLGRDLNRTTSIGQKNIHLKNLLFEELIRKEEFADNLEHRIRLVYRQKSDDIVMNAASMNTCRSCCVSRIVARVTGFCACGVGHPTGWSRSLANSKRFARKSLEKFAKSRCREDA